MRILLCVAGMPYAKAAVSFGSIIAGLTNSSITLLHVARSEKRQAAGERALVAAREMLPELTVDMRIRLGEPIEEILAEVQEGSYDLLIIGARQGGGLKQQLLGSVAQKVVRRASTSVLVARRVGPVLSTGEGLSLKRVLICTGGLDVSVPVIETGAWLSSEANAQATLLHVTSSTPGMYTGLNRVEETLLELLQTNTPAAQHLRHGAEILNQQQVIAELRLRRGIAADEILHEANEGDYDLIVIGTSGAAGPLKGWLLGNVTKQVVERASCSVLVVKQETPLTDVERP
jgi:nucleotide-binding universal stress UspA family protein